jgi:hypothetical protein
MSVSSRLHCKWRTQSVVLDVTSLKLVLIRRPKLTNGSEKFVCLTAYLRKSRTTDLGLFSDLESKIFVLRGFLYLPTASKLLKVMGFLHDIPSLWACIIIPFAYYLIFHIILIAQLRNCGFSVNYPIFWNTKINLINLTKNILRLYYKTSHVMSCTETVVFIMVIM